MAYDKYRRDTTAVVKATVPDGVEIKSVEFEGPYVVIYTKSLEAFAEDGDIVRKLAQTLRRRVIVRPDPDDLTTPAEAEEKIRASVPDEAEITNIWFDPATGEVTVEARNPGVAIGKHGQLLNQLKRETRWAPIVQRTPSIPSKTFGEIRAYLRMQAQDRKDILRRIGRRINREVSDSENWARLTTLGGFREVGRSCALLSTKDSKILIDCGVKFGGQDDATPYLNAPEALPLEQIDAVVLTHAHLDHSGITPLLFKYGFEGAVYCTAPTRDTMSMLMIDYLKVAFGEGRKAPYETSHIRKMVLHTIPLRWGETTDIAPDVRLTLQNAGHILGSSSCHFHLGDGLHNIVFSGDMKYEDTWLFNQTHDRFPRLESILIESTYGGYHDFQPTRREARDNLREIIQRAIERGGQIIVPVFAVGRSQEVMIVIENLVSRGEIPELPVYLDGMIMEATAIHTAYPEFLNAALRNRIFQEGENPFLNPIFNQVENAEMRRGVLTEKGPVMVLATSGMLNGGPVMEYFKNWCSDPRNSMIFVGYQAENTIGRKIQRGWNELTLLEKGKQISYPIKMQIETCDGFSGHSDRKQLIDYFRRLHPKPRTVFVGHGDETKCIEFAATLRKKFGLTALVPQNLETIRLA
jgi:hypothetical protein